jgi:hypothetical protein
MWWLRGYGGPLRSIKAVPHRCAELRVHLFTHAPSSDRRSPRRRRDWSSPCLGESARVQASPARDFGDGGSEHVGAVQVEKLDRLGGDAADISAGLDPLGEEHVDAGDFRMKPIASFQIARLALVHAQIGAMLGSLDALMLAPMSLVFGDGLVPVERSDADIIGDACDGA